jgi:serine/threonine protein kinase/Tol biopolymer transport system component
MISDPNQNGSHHSAPYETGVLIGHYRIIERIGTGGMGEVYLAVDIHLDRKVALKFLPKHLCQDSDCRKRFSREAQASAKLNHPHIVTIFEVNEFDGIPFFAMEYIEGEPLSNLIERKEITTGRAIEIAIQICEALNEAHGKGIIHRDIKPSNILIDKSGRAKLSDFGLATFKGTDRLTRDTSTIGTVYYMSPEQVRGEDVDNRSDIFSFGIVFYEMLTGQLPFKGTHEPSVMYSIVNEEPEPIAKFNNQVSEQLQKLVSKALTKDRNLRYQQVEQLVVNLGKLSWTEHRIKTRKFRFDKRIKKEYVIWLIFGLIALAIPIAVINLLPSQFKVTPFYRQVTHSGDVEKCAISADGKQIAFSCGDPYSSGAGRDLMIQEVIGGEPYKLLTADFIQDLRWSPDGINIAFAGSIKNEGGVYTIPRLGGKPNRILPVGGAGTDFGVVSWAPDGRRLLYHSSVSKEYFIVDYLTGNYSAFFPKNNIQLDWIMALDWSSDDKYFVAAGPYHGVDRMVIVSLIDSTSYLAPETPPNMTSPSWGYSNDKIYYLTYSGSWRLMKYGLQPGSTPEFGQQTILINGILSATQISISADRKKIVYPVDVFWSNLWFTGFDESGNVVSKQLTFDKWDIGGVTIAPDGQTIVYGAVGHGGSQLYEIPIEGGNKRQLTMTRANHPLFSPDGNQIAFSHQGLQHTCLAIVNKDGNNYREYINSLSSDILDDKTWTKDNKLIYRLPGNRNYEILDINTGITKKLFENDSLGWAFFIRVSPDDKTLALYWNRIFESDSVKAYYNSVLPIPDSLAILKQRCDAQGIWLIARETGVKTPLYWTNEGTVVIGWSDDGQWLYFRFVGKTDIYRININNRNIENVLKLAYTPGWDTEITPDKKGFIYNTSQSLRDVWMIENFDPDVK